MSDYRSMCNRCQFKCTSTPKGLIGRCGVVEVRMDGIRDKYPWMIADLSIATIEKVPLYHYKPGSWTLILWVPGCPYNCRNCPWNASTGGMDVGRIYELVRISVDKIRDYIESAKTDVVHITGGEPLILEWIYELIGELAENSIDVTIKSTLTISKELLLKLRGVNAVLVDIPLLSGLTPNTADIVKRAQILQNKGVHIEVQLSIGSNIPYTLSAIDKYVAELDAETPIHIKFVEPISEKAMEKIIDRMHFNNFSYVYVSDDTSGVYSTTYCPSCGKPVVIRNAYGVRKILLKDNKCPSCGKPIRIIGAEYYKRQRRVSRLFATGERLWRM